MIQSKVYINGTYQGQTSNTSWDVSAFGLQYYHPYSWRIDTYDTDTGLTTTGDTWTFTTKQVPTTCNYTRPDTYDPDLVWGWDVDTSTYTWISTPEIVLAGGGRYNLKILVVGHNCLYYS